jgi:NAD(P)-dependent dehydrogenase (short-subunit alcohol dehydrogenase family)
MAPSPDALGRGSHAGLAGSIKAMTTGPVARPVALVTGAGRRRGIATAVAQRSAETGWDVAFAHLSAYDARMPWGIDAGAAEELTDRN